MKSRFLAAIAMVVATVLGVAAQAPTHTTDTQTISVSGNSITVDNPRRYLTATFEEIITGAPSTVSIVIKGCMRGGTCDTLETYTTVANSNRKPTISSVYDSFTITASWTGGTSPSVQVNTTESLAKNSGGGGSSVPSVFGRTGAVTAQSGDYSAGQVSGLAASATTDTTNASNILSGMMAAARLPNPRDGVLTVDGLDRSGVSGVNASAACPALKYINDNPAVFIYKVIFAFPYLSNAKDPWNDATCANGFSAANGALVYEFGKTNFIVGWGGTFHLPAGSIVNGSGRGTENQLSLSTGCGSATPTQCTGTLIAAYQTAAPFTGSFAMTCPGCTVFPTSTAGIDYAGVGVSSFGTQLNGPLTVTMAGIAGSIGVQNTGAQENSSIDNVTVAGAQSVGIDIGQSTAQNFKIGAGLEVISGAKTGATIGTPSTFFCYKWSVNGPNRDLDNATCNPRGTATTTSIAAAVAIVGPGGSRQPSGHVHHLHTENTKIPVLVDGASNIEIDNINTGSTTQDGSTPTTMVYICGASSPAPCTTGLTSTKIKFHTATIVSPSLMPNYVIDDTNGKTITAAQWTGQYDTNPPKYGSPQLLADGGLGPFPTTPNGVPQIPVCTPSSGVCTTTWGLPGVGGRAVTITTTDTISSADCSPKRLEYLGNAATPITLPTATTLGVPTCVFKIVNNLSTVNDLTVTPTTWTCNGAATCVVHNGQQGWFYVDPNSATNWVAEITEQALTAGSNITFSRSSTGLSIAASAGSVFPLTVSGTVTSGGIPYFNSTTQESSSGILNTNKLIKGGGVGGAPTNSLFTDDGTTATYTGTGGINTPLLTIPGATSGSVALSATATGGTLNIGPGATLNPAGLITFVAGGGFQTGDTGNPGCLGAAGPVLNCTGAATYSGSVTAPSFVSNATGAFYLQFTQGAPPITVASTVQLVGPASGVTAYQAAIPPVIGTSGQALEITGISGALATLGWVTPASSGNLLNYQKQLTPITGNGAVQTLFTYNLPQNGLAAGACLVAEVFFKHSTGSASTTYNWSFVAHSGALANSGTSFAFTGSAQTSDKIYVCNNAGVQNAQQLSQESVMSGASVIAGGISTTSIDTAASGGADLAFTFNVANTDAVRPDAFIVRLATP